MPNWKKFSFKIEGKINGVEMTPYTIPLARLAEYLTDLAILMGHRESVHLIAVEDGSTAPVFLVDETEESRVIHRIRTAQRGMGPHDANLAYKRIDNKLREDDGVAEIIEVEKKAEIIEFPGRTLDLPQAYGPLKERASVVGVLRRVGGFDETVPIHLQRADETIFRCEADELIAKQLAPFYAQTIRVHGIASYCRGKEGMWELTHFRIQAFDEKPLSEDSFSQTIEKLRAIPGNEWNQLADPLEELHKIRHGEDGKEP